MSIWTYTLVAFGLLGWWCFALENYYHGKTRALLMDHQIRRAQRSEADPAPYKRLCSWCGRLISDGIEPVTHGICRDCYNRMKAEAVRG